MHNVIRATLIACALTGCTAANPALSTQIAKDPSSSSDSDATHKSTPSTATAKVAATANPESTEPTSTSPNGPWIGAAGASDFILAGNPDSFLGVWVDIPAAAKNTTKAPAAVSLVIDTSGSMSGAKMDNARIAARAFVDQLSDGDIVSIHAFDSESHERVPPTVLNTRSRALIRSVISELAPGGGTNMFDGLRFGEARAVSAPATHAVRRVVVISDGIATVGPSSPEVLGALAARGADQGVQVTALGVGTDYDENTLNALAIRSSGRLYHLSEPREMASILENEMGLLKATAVTAAFIEIIPAPGVQLLGADGVRADWTGTGSLRVPLGTMFSGQHREMLVRVRVRPEADGSHPLASVRLHFRDPSEGNLERVQEVIARYQVTSDPTAIDLHANQKTRAIIAVQEAGRLAVQAAQQVNDGRFDQAERELAAAETKLRESAKTVTSAPERQRIEAVATKMAKARVSTRAAAAAPPAAAPAARRATALDVNASGMSAIGY